ncbi:MAG: small multi-drug export protein, partial [Oscillospiraceae bacterium]|nr:small multi-drug export protein [Oscillospiraceae bacterium]
EERALKKSSTIQKGEFLGLLIFVGVPLPGTGGWTGALIADLLKIDFKKAVVAIFSGIIMATIIISFLMYGIL